MVDLNEIRQMRQRGEHEKARERLVELTERFPDDPLISYMTASVHDSLGLEREAVPHYVKAIQNGLEGTELHGAYLGLGSTHRTLGEYALSEQVFLEGLERFPEAQDIKLFLAMTRYNLAKFHDAVSALLTVIADTTGDTDLKQYERAIRFYAQDLDRSW